MGGIRITDRDLKVFRSLGEYGLLDTALLHRLHFKSVTERRCLQRVEQYLNHDLICRTALQVWYSNARHNGRIPSIYGLTEKGADMLEELNGTRAKRVFRSSPKPATLLHRLQIVRWRLAFDEAFRRESRPVPSWIHEQDVRSDLSNPAPPNQRSILFHRFSSDGLPVCCKPDAACLFTLDMNDGRRVPLIFYWEVDRSTEGHEQIREQKIRGYTELIRSKAFLRYWPEAEAAHVRIVFACNRDPRERRVKALANTISGTAIQRHCRFISYQDCQPHLLLREPVWRNADGEKLRLLNG